MRQVIWACVILLFTYGFWQFVRALRIGRRRFGSDDEKPGITIGAEDCYTFVRRHGGSVADSVADSAHADLISVGGRLSTVPNDVPSAVSGAASSLTSAAALSTDPSPTLPVACELDSLRHEVFSLRAIVETQREEIESIRKGLKQLNDIATISLETSGSSVNSDISPEYDEALALANGGASADTIAERCGISTAEAELVASLATHSRRKLAV